MAIPLAASLSCTFAPALIALVSLAGAPAFAGDTPAKPADDSKAATHSLHQERGAPTPKGHHHHHKKHHKKHQA